MESTDGDYQRTITGLIAALGETEDTPKGLQLNKEPLPKKVEDALIVIQRNVEAKLKEEKV